LLLRTLTTRKQEVIWRLPLFVAFGTPILLASLILYTPYAGVLYALCLVPAVLVSFVVLFLVAVRCKNPSQCLALFLALIAFLGTSNAVLRYQGEVRDHVRWFVWSALFKTELLSQPTRRNGQLRHLEWEATGFAGVANDTAYLVFDPGDALASTRTPRDFDGIPCKVISARRLEQHWYAIRFYTDQAWDDCTVSR